MSPSFHRFGEPEGAHCSLHHSPDGEITTQGREESRAGARKLAQKDLRRAQSPRQGGEPQGSGALVISQLETWQGSCAQRGCVWQGCRVRGGGWGL